MMLLRLLRCMPVLWMAYAAYSIVMVSSTAATEFDEKLKDYRRAVQLYIDGIDNSDPFNTVYSSKLWSLELQLNNNTCALEGGGGRYRSEYDSFVFIDGENVPQDAISFAGVFDVHEALEVHILRGVFFWIV